VRTVIAEALLPDAGVSLRSVRSLSVYVNVYANEAPAACQVDADRAWPGPARQSPAVRRAYDEFR